MRPPRALPLVLWALVVLCSGVELVLIAADYGLIGTPRWRLRPCPAARNR